MKVLERRQKAREERKKHEEVMKPIKEAERLLKKKLGRKLTNGERNFIRLEHVSSSSTNSPHRHLNLSRPLCWVHRTSQDLLIPQELADPPTASHRPQRRLGRPRNQCQTRHTGHDGRPSISQTHSLAVPKGIAVLDEEAGRGSVGWGDVG